MSTASDWIARCKAARLTAWTARCAARLAAYAAEAQAFDVAVGEWLARSRAAERDADVRIADRALATFLGHSLKTGMFT